MQKTASYLALILAVVALIFVMHPAGHEQGAATKQENVFQRVMRTNTLRCGYAVYAPYLTKDPATGNFGGIWYDLTNAVADHLGVKVDWAEEVGLGDIGPALDAGRIDVFCGGLWTAGKRLRSVDYLAPSAYEPILLYVRADDHRFDKDLSAVNDPAVSISTIDGEGGGLIAQEEFPRAKLMSLPQLTGYGDMFDQVVNKKADVLLAAPSGAEEYMKKNPGILRGITDKPVRVFAVALAVRYGEEDLRDAINRAQEDIIINGTMEKILQKYEPFTGAFLRVASPYVMPVKQ